MVSFLFSRNPQIGSRLIAWGSGLIVKDLEKVPSHVAVLMTMPEGYQFVMESVLSSGVRIVPFEYWVKRNEVCYHVIPTKPIPLSEPMAIMENIYGKKYDWGGILFFALCFVNHLLFKSPFPTQNLWEDPNKYFCSEAAFKLTDYGKAGMATPAKMCSDMIKTNEWR